MRTTAVLASCIWESGSIGRLRHSFSQSACIGVAATVHQDTCCVVVQLSQRPSLNIIKI